MGFPSSDDDRHALLEVAARVPPPSRPRSSSRGCQYSVLVGIAVAGVLGLTIVTHINGQSVLTHVSGVQIRYLWLAIGCSLMGFSLRAWRWGLLLQPVQRVRFRLLLAAELIGFAANSLFPFRVGEALKSVTVSRLGGLALPTVLGTQAAAGLFHLVALGFVLVVSIGLFPAFALLPKLTDYAVTVTGVLLVGAGIAWICVRLCSAGDPLLHRQPRSRWGQAIAAAVTAFVTGLRSVQTLARALVVITLSLLLWLSLAGRFYFVSWALGLDLPLAAIVFLQAIVGVGTAVPLSPAQLGTFEVSTIVGLRLFAVDEDTALACALLVRLIYSGPALLLGLACAVRLGVKQWGTMTTS